MELLSEIEKHFKMLMIGARAIFHSTIIQLMELFCTQCAWKSIITIPLIKRQFTELKYHREVKLIDEQTSPPGGALNEALREGIQGLTTGVDDTEVLSCARVTWISKLPRRGSNQTSFFSLTAGGENLQSHRRLAVWWKDREGENWGIKTNKDMVNSIAKQRVKKFKRESGCVSPFMGVVVGG